MRKETDFIISQLNETFKGDPWFGRSITALLNEVDEEMAFIQLKKQHSILELVWHMVNWRDFTINSLQPSKPVYHFDENDWRKLDHSDKTLWQQGLQNLSETQETLLSLLERSDDSILEKIVEGRKFDFRYLLYGIIQHDIYHLGQIAYIGKLLKAS